MNPIPDPWHGGLVGVKLTETDASERTVLHHAAACGHKHIVEWVCPKLKKPMKALSPLDPDPHVDANASPLMADGGSLWQDSVSGGVVLWKKGGGRVSGLDVGRGPLQEGHEPDQPLQPYNPNPQPPDRT